jgi:hypothetical protein
MNKKKYTLSRWYAFKMCNDINPLDLVHDCYVRYYNKHGQDLFDLDQALIFNILKQHYYSESRRYSKFKWRGEFGNRQFISLNDFNEDDNLKFELDSLTRTEDLLEINELDRLVISKLKHSDPEVEATQLKTYELMKEGYRDKDIGEIREKGRTTIFTYKTNIRKAVEEVLNYE